MPSICRRASPALAVFAMLAFLALLALLAPGASAANSRQVIPFQGAVAVKPGQTPLDANPYSTWFEIFTAAGGGAKVYDEVQSISIVNGVFSVELGGGTKTLDPAVIVNNADLWLQITIDMDRNSSFDPAERILPRTHLGAAPLSIFAATAGSATSAASANALKLPAPLLGASGAIGQFDASGAFISGFDNPVAIAPARGGLYRNNVCLAWGLIDANGALVSGFGIRKASYNSGDGTYEVELSNDVVAASSQAAYSVVATSLDTQLRPEVAIYEPRTFTKFGIVIFGLDGLVVFNDGTSSIPQVQSAFSVVVFGQQTK